MHKQVKEFCEKVKADHPRYFEFTMVMDIGSLDINGSNKYLFHKCYYFGVDVVRGPNVDIVGPLHEIEWQPGSVDVMISTEAFEHDFYLFKTLERAVELLAPGGLFLFTCATEGRKVHGTKDVHPELSPTSGLGDEWGEYYHNVTEEIVRRAINIEEEFKEFEFSIEPIEHSLQFWGIKQGER